MNRLPYKGNAVIVVNSTDDIQRVKDIIRAMDDHEFEYYFPENLVQTFPYYMEYVGKFELDVDDFNQRCDIEGIKTRIFTENDFDVMCDD